MRKGSYLLVAGLCAAFVGASAQVPSHCSEQERTIWSCRATSKIYSLCASRAIDRSVGYVQYRAGRPHAIEMEFPEASRHPSQAFHFDLMAHGVTLSFRNGAYQYEVAEDIKGQSAIYVNGPSKVTRISCGDSTDTLTLTSTLQFFESIGLGTRQAP